jgi:hypothetical protein
MSLPDARIRLFGPLSLTCGDANLTPKSAKAKALFALLATSPEMSRPRRWLEDKLWSDRGPEQASASLRQTLSEIRRGLASYPGLLLADRSTVALARDRISTDLADPHDEPGGLHEFLEGIDVSDPEFEDWLRTMRSHYAPAPAPVLHDKKKRFEVFCRSVAETAPSGAIGDILANQIGQNITEQLNAWRHADVPGSNGSWTDADINVTCQVIEEGKRSVAYFKIVAASTRRVLYSRAVEFPDRPIAMLASNAIARATFDAAEMVVGRLPEALTSEDPMARALRLAQIALQKIFAFDRGQLKEADSLLQAAYAANANPVYLAWQALIRTIQSIEMFDDDTVRLQKEAGALIGEALVSGTGNALVLSIIAWVQSMLFDDAEQAFDFARAAISVNPNNAFALQALAVAQMHAGDGESAYLNSRKSYEMSAGSTFRHWWDLYHCLVCLVAQRFDEALISAELAARRAPTFRPPLRNLLALYTFFGEADKALRVAQRLVGIESAFSLDRFVDDFEYPTRTLRQAGLLKISYGKKLSRAPKLSPVVEIPLIGRT